MPFLRNAWYVAAWQDEVGDGLFARTIIGEPVLLLRDSDGAAHAMGDRCPHRFAPLHLGKKIAGRVQCPYHGLEFAIDGKCVHNPHGEGVIPKAAQVKTYPVVERYRLIWIWMGDPARADPGTIPDFSFIDDPKMPVISGTVYGKGNYELYSDNILDLGHAEFLHTGLAAAAFTKGAREIVQDGTTVWSNTIYDNDYPSQVIQFALGEPDTRFDYVGKVRWDPPATMSFESFWSDCEGAARRTRHLPTFHIFTPETETTSFYFWAAGRNFRTDEPELSAQLRAGVVHAFENEDKVMIAAQQEMMGTTDLFSLDPILLPGDGGAIKARRVLAELIENEARLSPVGAA